MRHRRASRLVLVAWLATAVLLGPACSSDDDASAPNTTATTTSDPADPAGPSTTAGPGAASIAEVDFRNFTYEYPGVGPDDELSEVTVTDGEFSEGEQPGDSFYFEVVDVGVGTQHRQHDSAVGVQVPVDVEVARVPRRPAVRQEVPPPRILLGPLDADEVTILQIELGLVMHRQPAMGERPAQVGFELYRAHRLGVHGGMEKLYGCGFALARLVQGIVRVAQQGVCVLVIGLTQGDADATARMEDAIGRGHRKRGQRHQGLAHAQGVG